MENSHKRSARGFEQMGATHKLNIKRVRDFSLVCIRECIDGLE